MSKIPRFDAALDAIFSTLVPHEITCGGCKTPFFLEEGDIEFLKKLRVPPPSFCRDCRLQRRLASRCSFKPVFHKKPCSAPGHTEQVVSFYGKENPVRVFDDAYYRSDAWEGTQFGIEYNATESFLNQFALLRSKLPHQALNVDPQSVGCDYSLSGRGSKNCYYVAVPFFAENLQYGSSGIRSKDSLDFLELDQSEWCFNSVRVSESYNCVSCTDSMGCVDSAFLYDCRNCVSCFGCTNLRNKKYCFFNEQLTKEEYEAKMAEINLGSHAAFLEYQARFEILKAQAIRKNVDVLKTENSSGNQLRGCRNCVDTYRVFGSAENLRHCCYIERATDCMDVWGAANSSLVYESTGLPEASSALGSWMIRGGREIGYCGESSNIEYCFGCFGLKNKKFCILNTQYTEEEYWSLLDEIKTKMLERGEYGEYLPIAGSAVPYNDSNANQEYPLNREEVRARGWKWRDEEGVDANLVKMNAIAAKDLPDDSAHATEDLLGKAVVCEESGRPFRLTRYEFDFYKKQRLPLPRLHPDVRIERLLKQRHPYRLWDDACKKCGTAIKSAYDPAKKYTVYCEVCYQKEIA